MTASGQLRLPSCWSSVPVKSSVSSSPAMRGAQHDAQVALARLEHVLGAALAVGQLGQARAGAALGVVEHLGVGLAQRLHPDPLGELAEPQRAHPAGRQLRAQVGAALVGPPHLSGQLGDRRLVEHARLDHHALVGERAAVGRHRARGRAADVGVVGAVGGERDQLAVAVAKTGVITVMSGRWVPPR